MMKLIFIPGLLCDDSFWQPIINCFKHQYEIQIIDVSSCTDIDEFARSIVEGIDEDVILVGFSLGAWIALHAYSLLRDYCRGIILISSTPGNLTPSTQNRLSGYIEEIESGDFEKFINDDYEFDFAESNKKHADLKKAFMKMTHDQGAKVAVNQLRSMLEFNKAFPNMNEISSPSLLIRGQEDRSLNIPRQEKMLQEIPDAKLVEISNAAHYAPLENPEITALEIESWMLASKLH